MRRLNLLAVLAVSVWQLVGCGDSGTKPGDDTLVADTAPVDTAQPDTITPDTVEVDTVTPDTTQTDADAQAGDAVETDTLDGDTAAGDTQPGDTGLPDGGDTAVSDTEPGDTAVPPGFVVTKQDRCADAGAPVGTGTLPISDADDTTNYANDYSYSQDAPCVSIPEGGSGSWGGASPDVVYALTPSVSGAYLLVLDPVGFDPGMMVTTACGDAAACLVTTDLVDFAETGLQEVINLEMTAGTTYYVHIMGWSNATANSGAYTLTVSVGEDCDNQVDDNDDNAVDCLDPLCAASPNCDESNAVFGDAGCLDGVDNDVDGDTDCADDDCVGAAVCDEGDVTTYPNGCTDAPVDNDGDGLIDCADPDCDAAASCDEGNTTLYPGGCTNVDGGGAAIDDDGDGLANCADPDCGAAAACDEGDATLYPGGCTDASDNDGDGLTDCEDDDCAIALSCLGEGDTCETAFTLELGVPATANTADFHPIYGVTSGVCPGDIFSALGGGFGTGSKDVVYAFTPDLTGKYHFSLSEDGTNEGSAGGGFDNGLYITTDCATFAGHCLAAWDAKLPPNPEEFTISLQAGTTYFVIVDGWSSSTGAQEGEFTLVVTEPDPDEIELMCADTLDNEFVADGDVDCDDVDCFFDSECVPEICTDGVDNDHDGLTDCDDDELDAAGELRCPAHFCIPEICDSGLDDDGDGLTDCEDEECVVFVGADPADTCAKDGELCGLPILINVDPTTHTFVDTQNLCTFHNGVTASATAPSTCKATSATAGDVIYAFNNGASPQNVTVKVTPTEGYNLVLNVLPVDADCSAMVTGCVAAVDAGPSLAETVTFNALPDTSYLVVVDVSSATGVCTTTARNYTLEVTVKASETGACGNGTDDDVDGLADCFDPDCLGDAACPALGGSTCALPFEVNGDVEITTNTCNYTADFLSGSTNGCKATSSTSTAKDFAVKFTASHAGPYVAQLDATFDSVFNVVRSDTCPETPLAQCVGGVDSPDLGGKVTFNASAAGEVFWIVVDGYGSGGFSPNCGDVTFTITALDAEIIHGDGACGDGVDNDNNGLVDCYDSSCAVDTVACAALLGSTCTDPILLTDVAAFSADTCLYTSDFKANSGAGCAATTSTSTAQDLIVEFVAPLAGPYVARLDAAFDSVMNVVAGAGGCPASPLTACVGGVDSPNIGGKVAFTAAAPGDVFYVVVDGWSGSCGGVEFAIEAVEPEAGACADDVDNDADGLTDCADTDCAADVTCDEAAYAEGCGNGLDDDGDGKTDCIDADCVSSAACDESQFASGCSNTVDDDGDSKTDCADWNCKVSDAVGCGTPAGDACGMPSGSNLEVSDLPFESTALSTCDFGADHKISTAGGCEGHQGSKDVVFDYTPLSDLTVKITLTATGGADTVLNVSTLCAGNLPLPLCVASDDVYLDDVLGDTGESVTLDVDAGTTYFIYVNAWASSACTPFSLTVEEVVP